MTSCRTCGKYLINGSRCTKCNTANSKKRCVVCTDRSDHQIILILWELTLPTENANS